MEASFECKESVDQKLTFSEIEEALKTKAVPFEPGSMQLRSRRGRFNNFALLLSDQCPWNYVVLSDHYGVVFEGRGSIVKQLLDILGVLDTMNPRTSMKWHTLPVRKYPKSGVQEGLVNAAIHCDLSMGRHICVQVASDRMTVISPGNSYNISKDSKWFDPAPRNSLLGGLFRDMGMASMKLSGLYGIERAYKSTCLQPTIRRSDEQFQMLLPAYTAESKDVDRQSRQILGYLRECRGATLKSISQNLGTNQYYARRMLNFMEEKGQVFSMGPMKGRCYYPCKIDRKGCWDMPPYSALGRSKEDNGRN